MVKYWCKKCEQWHLRGKNFETHREYAISQDDFEELKSIDLLVKLKALQVIIIAAKNNVDIGEAVDILNEIIVSDDEELWQAASDALIYYYVNYISFYCSNFGSFPKSLMQLKSPDKDIRKRAARQLTPYELFKKEIGRNWKFMDDEVIQQLIDELNSSNVKDRLKSAYTFFNAVEDSFEIYQAVSTLQDALHDEERKVRWMAAEVLGAYIMKYRYVFIDYYMDWINDLQSSNAEERRKNAASLGFFAQGGYVEDKDERDMSFGIPALIACLYEEDPLLKETALNSLKYAQYEHDISYGLPAIIRLLDDERLNDLHETASSIIDKEKI